MVISRFGLTLLLAACILWSHWQGVSSSRLLAPNSGPASRHASVSQAASSGALRRTYSSPKPKHLAPKPPSLLDIVLLNGGAMVLPAAELSDTSPHSTSNFLSDTGQPPTSAATLPRSGRGNGTSASADQPAPVSKDGIILMALIGMLILAVAAGIDRDGPTSVLLASVKGHLASAGHRIWSRSAAFACMPHRLGTSVVAGYYYTISTAATALQQLAVLVDVAWATVTTAGLRLVLSCRTAASALQSTVRRWQEALNHCTRKTELPVCECEIRQRQGQQQQKLELTQAAVDTQQLSAAATTIGGNGTPSCTQR